MNFRALAHSLLLLATLVPVLAQLAAGHAVLHALDHVRPMGVSHYRA